MTQKPYAVQNNKLDQSHFHMPDPYEGVQGARQKTHQQEQQFQAACFRIFHTTEDGKDLAKMIKEQLLIPAMTDPSHPQAPNLCLYEAGFKDALRGLLAHADTHKKLIEANNG